jgi:tetratricopeptide (TPR) repeat protein
VELEPGTPLANAILTAQASARRGDVDGVDLAYERAAKISLIVAHDHCAKLLDLGAIERAARRCDQYLAKKPDIALRVLRAQIRSAATDHARAAHDVRQLRKGELTELQRAMLARVAALAAADRNDFPTAESELDAAERHFRRAGRTDHLEHIGNDRLLLDVRRGTRMPKLEGDTPHTPAEFLRHSTRLRRELRYEQALALMTRCVTGFAIEPALRFAVLFELTSLLVMTRQPGAARRLFPLLVAAAGPEVLSKLPDATRTLAPERLLHHVRKLIADNELTRAAGLLGEGNTALWHLTRAELAHACGHLDEAVHHFREAVARTDHAELKALALRELGDACADAGDEDAAVAYWEGSHRVEEEITGLQADTRLRMLRAARDQHDGRVLAAVRRVGRDGVKALPGLVVAVEAARDATMLDEPRDLPRFTDLPGAKRWLRTAIRHLPRGQVVWMMHATPDQLHHVIIGRRVTHVTTDVHISALTEAVHRLKAWKPRYDPVILGRLLVEFAGLIALDDVLEALPPKTTRIAVVAGGVLADVPLAGLPVPGTKLHLGQTHALSNLPCLSALPQLHRRAQRQRGAGTPIRTDVRSAITAGAAAVVAARWRAEQEVARLVLDGFGRHLAKLPRDRALQHALIEVADRHPADWACWTLHGDAGFQTTAGPLRRRFRKNGEPVPLETRPKVFLSFADKDRPHAEQLCAELEARNINAFLDQNETPATSDYHVLLWSANTPHRKWNAKEWTAFTLELTRRRAFLFVVRLDEEPLPPLLAPRKHVDLVDAADRLVATWRADRKSELPVFPQPVPPAPGGPTVAISVRSHDLGVTHIVMTPLHVTGAELHRTVHRAMQLPAEQATFDGTVGIRLSYELLQQNKPIAADQSTVELSSDVVDLAIRVESFGPRGPYNNKEFLPDDDIDEGLDVDQQRMLLVAAFRHLLP